MKNPFKSRLQDVLCAGLLVVGLGFGLSQVTSSAAGRPDVVKVNVSTPAGAGTAARTIGASVDSYAAVVNEVAPAVATIRSERRVRTAQQFPFFDDPFFQQFFGDRFRQAPQQPQERREGALGSGVVVSSDGYILTNHHVIDGAESIQVELPDRRSFSAKVVGSDPPSDLAVLKVAGSGLPTLPLGDSSAVQVGDIVLAIGNPLGVGQTVTMGIISAKGRATGLGDGSFEDFLQTDAPINQGNSGGALVNTRGELIGINSQILSPSGGNIGIGFAVPANMASNVMTQLIQNGRVRRGLLGVTVQGLTPDLAKSLRLDKVSGALVSEVQPGSAADRAGLKPGDVITGIEGQPVADTNALRNRVAAMKPGSQAELTILRDGREQTVRATLGELPGSGPAEESTGGAPVNSGTGLSVEPVTRETARRLNLDRVAGLAVTQVDPDGPAAEAGFRAGDLILEINGQRVDTASGLRALLQKQPDRPSLVLVRRDGRTLFLTLGLGRS